MFDKNEQFGFFLYSFARLSVDFRMSPVGGSHAFRALACICRLWTVADVMLTANLNSQQACTDIRSNLINQRYKFSSTGVYRWVQCVLCCGDYGFRRALHPRIDSDRFLFSTVLNPLREKRHGSWWPCTSHSVLESESSSLSHYLLVILLLVLVTLRCYPRSADEILIPSIQPHSGMNS